MTEQDALDSLLKFVANSGSVAPWVIALAALVRVEVRKWGERFDTINEHLRDISRKLSAGRIRWEPPTPPLDNRQGRQNRPLT